MKRQNHLSRLAAATRGKPASAGLRLLAIGGLCLLSTGARANLLFSDGFNYQSGINLYNAGASYQVSPSANTASVAIGSGTLTYPGLADFSPSGNDVSVLQGVPTAAQTSASFTAQTGGTLYASFLLDVPSLVVGQTQNYGMMGFLPTGSGYSSGADPCGVLFLGNGSVSSPAYDLGVRSSGNGSGSTHSYTGGTLLTNTVELVVLKYDWTANSGGGQAAIYLNPTSLGGNDPGLPSAVYNTPAGASPANLSQFYIREGGQALGSGDPSADFLVDDLRIGTTWADVTPVAVPEPATAALAALGLLGLAFAHRARK